ncbi:MAG: lytic transglycosylase domain-containing protein [Paracoccaceae bacterium]
MRRVLFLLLLSACTATTTPVNDTPDVVARWDHRPEGAQWSAALMRALQDDGPAMLDQIPDDIATFCPGFAEATREERAAVYVALFSGLARYESGWNPRASGGGGRYQGLLQISPQTARYHGCALPDDGLFDGAANLACAVRIANAAMARDGVVATGPRGIARDWPPLRDRAKRDEIATFTRTLPACAG